MQEQQHDVSTPRAFVHDIARMLTNMDAKTEQSWYCVSKHLRSMQKELDRASAYASNEDRIHRLEERCNTLVNEKMYLQRENRKLNDEIQVLQRTVNDLSEKEDEQRPSPKPFVFVEMANHKVQNVTCYDTINSMLNTVGDFLRNKCFNEFIGTHENASETVQELFRMEQNDDAESYGDVTVIAPNGRHFDDLFSSRYICPPTTRPVKNEDKIENVINFYSSNPHLLDGTRIHLTTEGTGVHNRYFIWKCDATDVDELLWSFANVLNCECETQQ